MNLFTENQVNQVYVVTNGIKSGHLTKAVEDKGKIYMGKTNPDASPFMNESIYFEHSGPGGITRSDNIDLDKIMYVHATPASDMAVALKQYIVKVDSSAYDTGDNSSYVLPNQDFILRIELTNYIGVSPEDSHYWKYGMVHTTSSMSPSDFYKKLAESILKNMSREAVKFVKLLAVTSTSSVNEADVISMSSVANDTYVNGNSGTTWANVTGLAIREVEPDWIFGLKKQKIIHFNITGLPFDNDGETIYWLSGENEDTEVKPIDSAVVLNNSKLAADYEYFFHGERGDQYRMVGWPDYIPTKYMANPEATYGYDFIQIHYYYTGPNEGAQKSEKDITFLVPGASGSSLSSVSQAIVAAIQAAIDAKGTAVANAAIDAAIVDEDSNLHAALNA